MSRLIVPVQSRLWRSRDGVWMAASSHASADYWAQYSDLFEEIVVVARSEVRTDTASGVPVEAGNVTACTTPARRGRLGVVLTELQSTRLPRRLQLRDDDVVYLRVPALFGVAAVWPRLLRRRRLLLHVVGDPEESLRGVLPRPLVAAFAAYSRLLVRHASAVLYVTRSELQQRFPARRGTPVGVKRNVLLRDIVPTKARTPVGGRQGIATLMTAGSQDQLYKGHDVLIRAVRRLMDAGMPVRAEIIGGGKYHLSLTALARELGVDSRIVFTGHLPGPELVRQRLLEADLFVLPSRTEGTPRVLLEAMSLGLPCIASAVGGIPELLPSQSLVPPGNVEALAAGIAHLLSDDQARLDAIAAGCASVAEVRADAASDVLREFLVKLKS